MELLVVKVLAGEEAELPEVVGDVLADVGDGAVRADDDLGFLVGAGVGLALGAGTAHDPAAAVLAFGLLVEHAALDHEGAGGVPEVEGEDFGFAGEEVVLDAEPLHGFEVAAEDSGRDYVGDGGDVIAAELKRVEGVEADLFTPDELLGGKAGLDVPLADAGVEVPAIEVDKLVGLHDLDEQLVDAGEREAEEMGEADDDVRDLDAGIVDVVLDADLPAGFVAVAAQEAGEGVAEDGVAEMADVRGFVGVDAGVLDETETGTAEIGVLVAGHALDDEGAVEPDVEVAGAGNLKGGDAGQVGELRGQGLLQLLSDDAGSLAEALGQLKGDGQGELAEDDGWRLLDGKLGEGEVVTCEQDGLEPGQQHLLKRAIHG